MLTKIQIEDKNFTYWRSSEVSPTNDRENRDDYLAVGFKSKGFKNEIQKVLLLSYDTDGYITITDYFNNPIRYREYYVNYVKVDTVEELDEVIDNSKFEIGIIDIDKLTTDYE